MLAEILEDEDELESSCPNELETQNNIIGFSKNEQLYYLNLWHGKNTGYITRATKNNEEFKQWHYHYSQFPPSVGQSNVYVSMNTFTRTYRRIEYLDTLNAIFVDIDFYTIRKCTLKKVLKLYEALISQGKIPRATAVINSGQGMYLEWKLEASGTENIAIWQELERHFATLFLSVGADMKSTDVSRILRIPGSTHVLKRKTTTVDLLDFQPSLVYSLEDLVQKYMPVIEKIEEIAVPELLPRPKKAKKNRSKIASIFNVYTLNYTRICDLIQLCELRKWDMYHHRELTLFLYRYWSACFYADTELALKLTLGVNEMFILPLSPREATNATKSAEKAFADWETEETTLWLGQEKRKGYNYKNERIIELLDITEDEQMQKDADGKYRLKTIIGTSEKYRRNNEKRTPRNENGLTRREQEKQAKITAVKELREKGLTQVEIATELQIKQGTVSKYLQN